MINRKKLLLSYLFVGLLVFVLFGVFTFNIRKAFVKGISTSNVSTPTLTPSQTFTFTPIPTLTNKPISVNTQSTTQIKQYGGWYWRNDLEKSQRWLSTDSAGIDIWTDSGDPSPTSTPTTSPQNSAYIQSSTGIGSSVDSNNKSIRTGRSAMTTNISVQKRIEQK